MPTDASSSSGLTISGKRRSLGRCVGRAARADHEVRDADPLVGEHLLGQRLVARQHQPLGRRAGVGHAQHLEHGRHRVVERRLAAEALGEVEDDVGRLGAQARPSAGRGCRGTRTGAPRGPSRSARARRRTRPRRVDSICFFQSCDAGGSPSVSKRTSTRRLSSRTYFDTRSVGASGKRVTDVERLGSRRRADVAPRASEARAAVGTRRAGARRRRAAAPRGNRAACSSDRAASASPRPCCRRTCRRASAPAEAVGAHDHVERPACRAGAATIERLRAARSCPGASCPRSPSPSSSTARR